MKCFAMRSQRPAPRPRGLAEAASGRLPCRPVVLSILVVLAVGPGLGGCVSTGTHESLQAEKLALEAEKRALEKKLEYMSAANRSLDEELVRLGEESEDVREERAQLEQRVSKLAAAEATLTAQLAAGRRELAQQSVQLQRVSEMRGAYDGLVADLESEVAAGQIEIAQLREGLRLNVSQDILFGSGSATLNAEGREVILSVAKRLVELPYRIVVEGHSDNVKIRRALSKRYPSNWELAGARASSVVRLLLEVGIAGDRLTAVSRGMYYPVAPNDSPEGRALNRRIEIRLLPDESAELGDLDRVTKTGLVSEPKVESESSPGEAPEQP
jgi:chemotaxis protein MotB